MLGLLEEDAPKEGEPSPLASVDAATAAQVHTQMGILHTQMGTWQTKMGTSPTQIGTP